MPPSFAELPANCAADNIISGWDSLRISFGNCDAVDFNLTSDTSIDKFAGCVSAGFDTSPVSIVNPLGEDTVSSFDSQEDELAIFSVAGIATDFESRTVAMAKSNTWLRPLTPSTFFGVTSLFNSGVVSPLAAATG
jgi:hypothetical protein